MKTGVYCKGEQCSARNTCLRHSLYRKSTNSIGGFTIIRTCTNQKKYIQDEDKVVRGR